MAEYLHIKNWEQFQHYADRSPPWIKLHRSVLDDYEFTALPDASKAHLMLLWLLASSNEGRIPSDPAWLSRRLATTEPIDLELFVRTGFLIPEQPASTTVAERKHEASNVLALARSREERRGEEKDANARARGPDFDRFWQAYPRRVSKGRAERAFAKIKPDEQLMQAIIAGVERAKTSDQWTRESGRYIPHPASWLNARGWEDECLPLSRPAEVEPWAGAK